ncbi:helix-turn-helix transcriptional regulator [Granulicella sp. L46]|uniref:helix-turn-helix transcriptional regulator n=1 Tax=Granulicella sp. L46 TaxID=1641865 RepID=UPI00131B9991|nr:helix-turn-helix transcriptional regulator [Granulicella sp. L46]
MSLQSFSDLLEVLYSAPLDQEQWQEFLTLLCHHTSSKYGLFFCADTHLGVTVRAMGGSRHDIDFITVYNERYGTSDPFRAPLIRNAKIGVFQGDDILPHEGLLQTDMYRDLAQPVGARYATLVPLTLSVRRLEAISLWRTPEMGPMDEDCNQLLRLLLPHIKKALEIHRELGAIRQRLAGAEAIADASFTATFLVKRSGIVIHRNAAADSLVADGRALTLSAGVLRPLDQDAAIALRKALSGSHRAPASSVAGPNHAILLPRTDGGRPSQLLFSPLPQKQTLRSGADFLILVIDPERATRFPDDVLRELYRLTPAEVEVANGILMGYSPDEIACLRRASAGTVRNQLKSIMGKTNTNRQSEMVRLLMAIPQPSAN